MTNTTTNTTSRRILITGTSTGFGHAASRALAARGHTVFATMRGVDGKNREQAEALRAWAARGGHTLHVIELDVTSDASVQAGVTRAVEIGRGIDVLISNAGVGTAGIAETFTPEQVSRMFETNVVGSFRVARAVLPVMREARAGYMMFVSSTVGRVIMPFMGPYTSTKFALEALAESMAFEVKPLGIDVTIIQPGAYATSFFQHAVVPADLPRAGQYGPVNEFFQGYVKMFEAAASDGTMRDPNEIADTMVRLVEGPREERPLRANVDVMLGQSVTAINQVCAQAQATVMAAFGAGKP